MTFDGWALRRRPARGHAAGGMLCPSTPVAGDAEPPGAALVHFRPRADELWRGYWYTEGAVVRLGADVDQVDIQAAVSLSRRTASLTRAGPRRRADPLPARPPQTMLAPRQWIVGRGAAGGWHRRAGSEAATCQARRFGDHRPRSLSVPRRLRAARAHEVVRAERLAANRVRCARRGAARPSHVRCRDGAIIAARLARTSNGVGGLRQ